MTIVHTFLKKCRFQWPLTAELLKFGKNFFTQTCTNSSCTGTCILLSRKMNGLAQICQYFHISTYMLLMNNIDLVSLRCPYFIYYINRNKIHKELCSIFEIRIMLKRCLSPLKTSHWYNGEGKFYNISQQWNIRFFCLFQHEHPEFFVFYFRLRTCGFQIFACELASSRLRNAF